MHVISLLSPQLFGESCFSCGKACTSDDSELHPPTCPHQCFLLRTSNAPFSSLSLSLSFSPSLLSHCCLLMTLSPACNFPINTIPSVVYLLLPTNPLSLFFSPPLTCIFPLSSLSCLLHCSASTRPLCASCPYQWQALVPRALQMCRL